ncbi:MAG: 4-alpha-glucanotransferase, partial [Verrucomicrobiota bacterium]
FQMILEAANGSEVIAEDLGTVPDYVRPSLESLAIAGMKVPQWEFHEGQVTSGLNYPNLSFAAYATHDHAPMKAQWDEAHAAMSAAEPESDEWREPFGFLSSLCTFAGIEREGGFIPEFSAAVWEKLFREICFSNSDRVAIMISDLLGETERINVPGVMDGTNWSYRIPVSSQELAVGENFWELREMLKKALNETGRSRRVGNF